VCVLVPRILLDNALTGGPSSVNKEHSPKLFIPPLCEILWRYFLVAPKDQWSSLTLINNYLAEKAKLWEPGFVDCEDSRGIIRAYNKGLAPVCTQLFAPLPVTAMSVLLHLVVSLFVTGCEDLLPSLFRLTINRLWDSLLNEEEAPRFIGSVQYELIYFRQVPHGFVVV
jgi:hypothetical protein